MLPSLLLELTNRHAQELGLSAVDVRSSPEERTLCQLEIDSRKITKDGVFVALRGVASDGHTYLASVLEKGAALLVIDHQGAKEHQEVINQALQKGRGVWIVENTRAMLAPLSKAFFQDPLSKLRLVGVTGTNGKTTSTWLMFKTLSASGFHVGLIGTMAYLWGDQERPAANTTPDSLTLHRLAREMVDDGVQALVMEVSSHALAGVRLLGVKFDHVVFTNLTQDHLDFHGEMDAYRQAKWQLFEPKHLRQGATMTINVGNEEGRALYQSLRSRQSPHHLESYAMSQRAPEADWSAEVDASNALGVHLRVNHQGDSHAMHSPMIGVFNVENLLVTASVAHAMGVSMEGFAKTLNRLEGVPGRLQRVSRPDAPVVFVDYAHTPDALERALETLRPLVSGQGELVVVFGCGGDRDRGKRAVMGGVARRLADRVVLTSDNPRSEDPELILDEIESALSLEESDVTRWVRQVDRAKAIEFALTTASSLDIVLIAGKGHETYQEGKQGRVPFDDVEQASRHLENESLYGRERQ